MTGALGRTLGLLAVADGPVLGFRDVEWESMRQLRVLVRREFSRGCFLSDREEEVCRLVREWMLVCQDGPVPPLHPSTGIADVRRALSDAVTFVGSDRVRELQQLFEVVAAEDHPAGPVVLSIVAEYPGDHVLVVRNRGVLGVRDWLRDNGLDEVSVVQARAARDREPWSGVTVIFGEPARYYWSAYGGASDSQAAAKGGWLLTAPPSHRVFAVAWPGHGRRSLRDLGAYAPWEGGIAPKFTDGSPPPKTRNLAVPQQAGLFDPVQAIGLPAQQLDMLEDLDDASWVDEVVDVGGEVAPPTPALLGESAAGETTVPVFARVLRFRLGRETLFAYFSTDAGPSASVVSVEGGVVAVFPIAAARLHPGHYLMFRLGSRGTDELDNATRAWLRERHGAGAWAAGHNRQQELKDALRSHLEQHGRTHLVETLRAVGISPEYAAAFPSRAIDPEFIAPLKQDVYRLVCRAVGLAPPRGAFQSLHQLRTARRSAGHQLAVRAAQLLSTVPDLFDRVDETGGTVLTEPGLEGTVLITIHGILEETMPVPVSRLGHLLTQDGRTWNP